MSAAIINLTDRRPANLPDVVELKITAFLSAGMTGQIVLDVKEGRVLAYKLTEAGRVSVSAVDSDRASAQD